MDIRSTLPIPELVPLANGEQSIDDLVVNEGLVHGLPPLARESGYYVSVDTHDAYLFVAYIGAIHVRDGREITFEPTEDVSEKFARLFVLGPGLAMALHQRGNLVLHSSSVALSVPGGKSLGVGFLGDSGQGKSTFAATLYERGHRVIADDVTPVHGASLVPATGSCAPDNNVPPLPLVYPGCPSIKLWPSAATALYSHKEAVPLMDPSMVDYPRREKSTERDFSLEPLPLTRLYQLEEGNSLEIVPMSRAEGLMSLVRNSYWVADLQDAQQAEHFRQCTALVDRVGMFRLRRPRDLSLLNDVAEMVERHAASAD